MRALRCSPAPGAWRRRRRRRRRRVWTGRRGAGKKVVVAMARPWRRQRSGEVSGRDREGGERGGSGRRERGVEVGGEEVEASRGGVDLILSGESPSRRSGGARPCCDPGRGNRGEDDPGRGWAGPARVGRGSGQALCTWPSAQWPVLLHFCFVFYFFSFLFYLF